MPASVVSLREPTAELMLANASLLGAKMVMSSVFVTVDVRFVALTAPLKADRLVTGISITFLVFPFGIWNG